MTCLGLWGMFVSFALNIFEANSSQLGHVSKYPFSPFCKKNKNFFESFKAAHFPERVDADRLLKDIVSDISVNWFSWLLEAVALVLSWLKEQEGVMFFFILRNFKKNWTCLIWATTLPSFPKPFSSLLWDPLHNSRGAAPVGSWGSLGRGGACSPSEPSALVEYVTSPARALLSQVAGAQTH